MDMDFSVGATPVTNSNQYCSEVWLHNHGSGRQKEKESLDPQCWAAGEIPEELHQAQFLQSLGHIASPGMQWSLHTARVEYKVEASADTETPLTLF